MFVISLKSLLWPWCSSRNVDLSKLHDPAEEKNEISPSTMIACAVSKHFKILFVIAVVSLYVATRIFSWSCIFPGKCVLKLSDFKVLLKLICSIPLLQHITVKIFFGYFLVLLSSLWRGLNIQILRSESLHLYVPYNSYSMPFLPFVQLGIKYTYWLWLLRRNIIYIDVIDI